MCLPSREEMTLRHINKILVIHDELTICGMTYSRHNKILFLMFYDLIVAMDPCFIHTFVNNGSCEIDDVTIPFG